MYTENFRFVYTDSVHNSVYFFLRSKPFTPIHYRMHAYITSTFNVILSLVCFVCGKKPAILIVERFFVIST